MPAKAKAKKVKKAKKVAFDDLVLEWRAFLAKGRYPAKAPIE